MPTFTPRKYQELIVNHILDNPRCAVWASMGTGKLQPNSEPVATPNGWTPMGELKVGDEVVGANGLPTAVTGVFPQGVVDILRVEFNDGSWTRVGAEHLWRVFTASDRYSGKPGRVTTTAELVASGLHERSGNTKWFIPMVRPVQLAEKTLPIDPYLMGLILGDGHVGKDGQVMLTTDVEILATLPGNAIPHKTCAYVATQHIAGCRTAMRAFGLNGKRSWEKTCPRIYLEGSIAQRRALLQGLLDTDSYAMPDGGIEFTSTAENLIDAVGELVTSLGGVARKSAPRRTKFQNGIGRVSWRINVKLPPGIVPFRLARKLATYVPPSKYPPTRGIKSITADGIEEATCISVAAKDKLYVTRHHIVTHNTSATLNALDTLLMLEPGPVLVLAPLRVANSTWPDEVEKWDNLRHLKIVPITGTEAERVAATEKVADIYTTNYDNLIWLVEFYGPRWPFTIVVADESTRLKSFRLRQGGKRSQALGRVAHTKIKRFIELTGTPAPNGLLDLWGQMWFIDIGARLGRTYTSFKERWFRSEYNGATTATENAQEEIQERLRDVCLTIDAKDWFDLKEPIVSNVYITLPPRVQQFYKDMEKEMYMQIEEHEIEAFNAAAKSQKLLQLASGAVYVDPAADSDEHPKAREWRKVHDAKLDALETIIEEANGAPVMVAYHFRSDLARIQARFKKARQLDTDKQTIKDWNAGKIQILLAHPQSAGHGLNLQDGGNILVYFSHNWNLEDRLQILERIGPVRQLQAGHDRPVFVYNIIAAGTVDELVLERIASKREVQDILLEAAKKR